MNDPVLSWSVETCLLGGYARASGKPFERSYEGVALEIVDVEIPDRISYAQHSSRHLMLAAIADRRLMPDGGLERRERPPCPSLSVAPAGAERRGLVRRRKIRGVRIAMDAGFVEDACEERLNSGWQYRQDVIDPKGYAIVVLAAEAARSADDLACETLLLSAARHLGRNYASASSPRDDGWLHPRALLRAIDRMRAEHGYRLTLSDLARDAGLSVSAFSRAFRGSTGMTPMNFALELRLNRAHDLLATTDMTVRDVAARAGFSSPSHLIRLFRARRGHPPGSIRRSR